MAARFREDRKACTVCGVFHSENVCTPTKPHLEGPWKAVQANTGICGWEVRVDDGNGWTFARGLTKEEAHELAMVWTKMDTFYQTLLTLKDTTLPSHKISRLVQEVLTKLGEV